MMVWFWFNFVCGVGCGVAGRCAWLFVCGLGYGSVVPVRGVGLGCWLAGWVGFLPVRGLGCV